MSRRRKWSIVGIALGVVIAAIAINWYWFLLKPLDAELALYRSVGLPTSTEELLPDPIDDHLNAATLYERAFSLMPRRYSSGEPADLAMEDPWATADLELYVEPWREATAIAREAALRPQCVWTPEIETDGNVLLPYLGGARRIGTALNAEAVLQSRDRNWDDAVQTLEAGFIVAEHVGADPYVISQRVQILQEEQLLKTLERAFREQPLPENRLAELLARRDHRRDFGRGVAIDGLSVLNLHRAGTLRDSPLQDLGYDSDTSQVFDCTTDTPALYFIWERRDVANVLRYNRIEGERLGAPIYEQIPDPPIVPRADRSDWYPASRIFAGAFGRMNNEVAAIEARIAMAFAALRLRELKAETGAYPEDFDAPEDPFTGMPLEYERVGDGFVLKSAGTDREGEPVEWWWE